MRPASPYLAALATALLLSGCAAQDRTDSDDLCPPGLTVYCETYHGKPQRCFCAHRGQLEDILEPRQEPY